MHYFTYKSEKWSPRRFQRDVLDKSNSYNAVYKRIGYRNPHGQRALVRAYIDEHNLVFCPRIGAAVRGERVADSEVFKINTLVTNTTVKNRFVKKTKNPLRCAICRKKTWRQLPIPLEMDHVNGNNADCRISNLRMVCRNCHAQTPTFSGKNRQIRKVKESI